MLLFFNQAATAKSRNMNNGQQYLPIYLKIFKLLVITDNLSEYICG